MQLQRFGTSHAMSFPITRQHAGIPLGNGNLGAMIFGQDNTFSLAFSLANCWDRQFSENLVSPCPYQQLVDAYDPLDVAPIAQLLREAGPDFPQRHQTSTWLVGTRVPAGRFNLKCQDQLDIVKIDYLTATATIFCPKGKIDIFIPMGDDVIIINDPNHLIEDVQPDPVWNRLHDLWTQFGFQEPVMLSRPDGSVGWFQPQPADPGTMALATKTSTGYQIAAQLASSVAEAEAVQPQLRDVSELQSRHVGWWRNYWAKQPVINLPYFGDIDFFFNFALYKFAAATAPGATPAGLQGPWLEDYQRPPWSADYHFNVNIQQIYSLAFPTGNLEHLQPLFDMLESQPFQESMRQNARMMFGIEDGLLMTHAVDDRGKQVGGLGPGAMLDFACGGWTALLYWWYYRYTVDRDFLRDRAYPFMKGVMRVYEETLQEYQGRLSIPLAISAEYGFTFSLKVGGREVHQCTGRDPSSQLSCVHALANALIETAEILGEQPKPVWLDIKRRLPHMTTIGEGDNKHLAIWEGQDLDLCHRHHSHLSLVTPFDITDELTEEENQWLANAIDHWILRGMGQWSEWCYPWAMQIHARRGFTESPMLLFELWEKTFINEAKNTVYLPQIQGISAHRRADMLKPKETTEIMQLDGTMAGATAILDMLVHELGRTVRLFHGVPKDWQDVSFSNVTLPGKCLISAKRQRGHIQSCVIQTTQFPAHFNIILEPGADPIEVDLRPRQTLILP